MSAKRTTIFLVSLCLLACSPVEVSPLGVARARIGQRVFPVKGLDSGLKLDGLRAADDINLDGFRDIYLDTADLIQPDGNRLDNFGGGIPGKGPLGWSMAIKAVGLVHFPAGGQEILIEGRLEIR